MIRKRCQQRRGAAAIEFAIVAIPLFVLIFACFEVSRLYMIESMAEDAAFEALRHVMVAGSKKAEGEAKAETLLSLLGTQDASIVITPFAEDDVQDEINDDTDEVAIDITIPMSSNAFLLSAFTKSLEIKKQARMSTERYKGFYDGNTEP
jgi:hypothetical protein